MVHLHYIRLISYFSNFCRRGFRGPAYSFILLRFRSKLPVVSNLTAMNLWDGVCMFFIYASFIEFILVNYLARWVQDPEQQKKKKENAILDVSMTVWVVSLYRVK